MIKKQCVFCNESYYKYPSTAKGSKFCSRLCQNRWKSKFDNPFKGKQHTQETKRKLSLAMVGKTHRKENNRISDGHGYIFVYRPQHPLSNSQGYMREHRLVMEKHLGRQLNRKEVIHHIDRNKRNNQLDNLILFENNKDHYAFHWNLINYIIEKFGFQIIKDYYKWFCKHKLGEVNVDK